MRTSSSTKDLTSNQSRRHLEEIIVLKSFGNTSYSLPLSMAAKVEKFLVKNEDTSRIDFSHLKVLMCTVAGEIYGSQM